MSKIIVSLDTETTGLIKPEVCNVREQPYIIEIACVKSNDEGMVIERFHSYIKPPIPLPAIITKITGITDSNLSKSTSFIGIYKALAGFFVGADILTAHNLAFDREMLANELIRIDQTFAFPFPPRQICTVRETTKMNGYRLNMQKLHVQLFNKEFEGAHGAKADVEAQAKCFFKLVNMGIIKL